MLQSVVEWTSFVADGALTSPPGPLARYATAFAGLIREATVPA